MESMRGKKMREQQKIAWKQKTEEGEGKEEGQQEDANKKTIMMMMMTMMTIFFCY